MDKQKLFIADVDPVHVQNVRKALATCESAVVIGSSGDGRLALEQITALRPDVVMTEILLPSVEGMMLLRNMMLLPQPPLGIVCTRFYSDLFIDSAYRNGASYVMFKPIDYSRLPHIIEVCCNQRRQRVPTLGETECKRRACHAMVRELLATMGIPAKVAASVYLSESLVKLSENKLLLRNLSKGLYAEIAAQLHTTGPRVERSLRSAIQTAYARGALSPYFSQRPTNKDFIEFLLRKLEE